MAGATNEDMMKVKLDSAKSNANSAKSIAISKRASAKSKRASKRGLTKRLWLRTFSNES